MKTDTELQHAVMEELAWEPSVDAAEIGVSAESGIVTLSGIVKSLPQKWAAEKAAQRVSGVQAVTDEITVKLPGDGELTDTEVAEGPSMPWTGMHRCLEAALRSSSRMDGSPWRAPCSFTTKGSRPSTQCAALRESKASPTSSR